MPDPVPFRDVCLGRSRYYVLTCNHGVCRAWGERMHGARARGVIFRFSVGVDIYVVGDKVIHVVTKCVVIHVYIRSETIPLVRPPAGQSVFIHITKCVIYRPSPPPPFTATIVTNLGVDMARFTQFPLMIPRWAIIYKIISPGATGNSI